MSVCPFLTVAGWWNSISLEERGGSLQNRISCGLAHRPKAPGAHVVPGCACGPRGACAAGRRSRRSAFAGPMLLWLGRLTRQPRGAAGAPGRRRMRSGGSRRREGAGVKRRGRPACDAGYAWSVRRQSHGPSGRRRVPCEAESARTAKLRTHNLGHIPREYGVLSDGIA